MIKELISEILSEESHPRRKRIDIPIPDDIKVIRDAYEAAGKELYLVGGAVRDALLGKTPKDYDLATDALPDETVKIISALDGFKTDEVGKAFGVVIAKTPWNDAHEIATFRTDDTGGRRPDSVTFTTIENDVNRRDLTINALFYDLSSGVVVDYVGGIDDLESGIVRTVGDPGERFEEDRLRVLRALRFAARLGSELNPATRLSIEKNPDIPSISPERIRDEFLKMIKSAQSIVWLQRELRDLGLLRFIFPGLKVHAAEEEIHDPVVLIALMLQDEDAKRIRKKLNALKYTKDEASHISFLVSLQRISVKNASVLKKEFNRTHIMPQVVQKFGEAVGIHSKTLKAFIQFAHQQPTVNASDLMAKGLRNQQIGAAMKAAEDVEFQRLLNEYVRLLQRL